MQKSHTCNVHNAVELIGSKWTILIIHQLCQHHQRGFNELLHAIDGINPRALSTRLKEMTEHGLIIKTVVPASPPQVEYSLSEKGSSLKTIVNELGEWADSIAA